MLKAKKACKKNKNVKACKKLIASAFPKEEQALFFALQLRKMGKDVIFLSFYDNDEFVGLCYLVSYHKLLYILCLAVKPGFRSMGY